ncbi:RidA family protein [Parapusillimonas granuli]|uniref:RidA family protein n=1 Tax=Parapusillimonas granuli TaxID=380911 RepID=A0A853G0K9_9BURK|nr:RidA family protein [Parapusillimonas granuli]MBB5213972.1 enamine deaminase RidA (YjgF/YER057c/UK114 family) [Parapusillimonas granuli]NYT50393.1 RidA family protein [Parapusillimonas granuli]
MNTETQRLHSNARLSKVVIHPSGLVFLSGQTSSGTTASSIEEQTQEVLRRIDAYLAEAGTHKEGILSATIYLREIDDFGAMNQVWERWVPAEHAPARCTVRAQLASPQLRIEISVIAAANITSKHQQPNEFEYSVSTNS